MKLLGAGSRASWRSVGFNMSILSYLAGAGQAPPLYSQRVYAARLMKAIDDGWRKCWSFEVTPSLGFQSSFLPIGGSKAIVLREGNLQ